MWTRVSEVVKERDLMALLKAEEDGMDGQVSCGGGRRRLNEGKNNYQNTAVRPAVNIQKKNGQTRDAYDVSGD